MKKFQLAEAGSGDFTAMLSLLAVSDKLRNWLQRKTDGPRRLREHGKETWGPWKNHLAETMRNLRAHLKEADAGDRWYVDSTDGPTYVVRVAERDPWVPDIEGHPAVNEMYKLTKAEFGTALWYSGSWYCRFIDGTRTVSRHGYYDTGWKGAAVDLSTDYMSELLEVADFQVNVCKTYPSISRFDSLLLVADKAWTPSRGWHSSGAAYHTHTHWQVEAGRACSP